MPLKDDWSAGESYPHTAANAVAAQVNQNTDDIANAGSAITPTAVKTSGYTAAVGDLVPADATSGGFTVTLPSAPADRSLIAVKKVDSSSNTVTVQRSGSDVFNVSGGSTTVQLTLQDQTILLQYKSSGAIWYVTAHGMPPAALDTRYATLSGTQTLTNKTLTNPKTTTLYDTNGNVIFSLTPTTSAANYVGVGNAASGAPYFAVSGSETDINLDFYTKGLGSFRMRDGNSNRLLQCDAASSSAVNYPLTTNSTTGNRVKYGVAGSDTNIDLDLVPKGTGVVKANNNPVGVKVSVPSTASSTGVVGQWAADSGFLYICTATNTWLRVAIASW